MCALLLRPPKQQKNAFFRGFDAVFRKLEGGYLGIANAMIRRTAIVMVLFLVIGGFTVWQFGRLPTGFLPLEDQGYLMVSVQLPDASSLERTNEVLDRIDGILENVPGIEQWVTFGGFSLIDGTNASNAGTVFVIMDALGRPHRPQSSPRKRSSARCSVSWARSRRRLPLPSHLPQFPDSVWRVASRCSFRTGVQSV